MRRGWCEVTGPRVGARQRIEYLELGPGLPATQGGVMKPRGLLMIEHRLIEKMLKAVEKEIGKIRGSMNINPIFIDTAVDFIRTYADRTHHGKEEDILPKIR